MAYPAVLNAASWAREKGLFSLNITSADSADHGILAQALGKLARALRAGATVADRRLHYRLPAHGPLRLTWRDETDEEREFAVHAIDVSPRGLAFRSRIEISVGGSVTLTDGLAALSGLVRHCTPDGAEFAIGIEVRRIERSEGQGAPSEQEAALEVALAALTGPDAGNPSR